MEPSVNFSKITPPVLPEVLHRTRLLSLLEKNQDKKLTLIFGQAAQGKTTLAASYAKNLKFPFAWMNLKEEDSDPVNFCHLLVHSLEHALKGKGPPSLPSHPSGMISPKLTPSWFREWTRSLFAQISTPLQIIIDNLHHLSQDSRSFQFLQGLLDETPVHIRFMMLSREVPPPVFEFQHLKIGQQALILTNEDLAFTQGEVREFFKKIRKSSLNTDQIKKVFTATEGWAGGLILLLEGLDRLPEETITKYLSAEVPHRLKRGVFQYLGKEIFSSLSEEVQTFLVKSSIIDLIEPHFIKDLVEVGNPQDILREHVRKSLFVESIYDKKKGWLFRYHPLFRDFLNAKFETEVAEEEKRELFLKAGRLYVQRGDLESALKSYLRANAYLQAASVMESLGMNLLQRGRTNDLAQWVRSFPRETVIENPWLLFYQAMTLLHVKGRENVIHLEKAYALFKQKGDQRGMLLALAQLIIASIRSGFHLIPVNRLLEEGETLVRSGDLEEFQYERAILWNYVGIGYILVEGHIRRGIEVCRNSNYLARQMKDTNLQAYAMIYWTIGLIFVGDFGPAEENCRQIEKLAADFTYPELQFLCLFVNCVLSNHQGHYVKPQSLLEELQKEIEKFGLVSMSPWIHELKGSLKLGQGELHEAEEIGNLFLGATHTHENPFFKGLALRLLGLIHLHQGLFQKGKETIEKAIDIFSKESISRYELHRVKSILGLLCIQLKEYQRAERELDEVLQYYSDISSPIWIAETHLSIALLQWAQGKKAQAALSLKRGFGIAKERGYERFFVLGQRYHLEACLLALKLKVEETDYVSHLLVHRLASVAEERLQKEANDQNPFFREQVWEILRSIHRSKASRLRIETLGGFRVFRGESLIKEEEWIRNQPKQLLMAIVSHGTQKITKDLLIDDLWPEAEPAAGDRNLKAALYNLRKSLEPVLHKDFGSSYVHLHDNLILLDPELCGLDIEQFSSTIKRGEGKGKTGDFKGALRDYAEAMEIYRGDFLPEVTYGPWADLKRDELRGKYTDLLYGAARLYERQGALKKAIACYKKTIQADPLLEESYQKLMTLYFNKGMPNEALRTYEDCKKALKTGLKTKPEATTTALYNKILEKARSG